MQSLKHQQLAISFNVMVIVYVCQQIHQNFLCDFKSQFTQILRRHRLYHEQLSMELLYTKDI